MKIFLPKFTLTVISIFFTFFCQAQYWPIVADGNQISGSKASYTSIITTDVSIGSESYMSVPHVAYTENKAARVKRYINGEWQSVGGEITQGNSSYTYLFADDRGQLYLNYVDESTNGQKRLAVRTYNSQNNTWQALGGTETNLYVSAGSVLNDIGSALSTSHNSWMAFDQDNTPYVVFSEFGTNSGRPVVKKFNGTIWESVGSSPVSTDKASSVGIAFDNEGLTPYITYMAGTGSTGTIKVYKFANAAWQTINVPAQIVSGNTTGQTTGTRHSNIIIDHNNYLYIAYFNSGNNNKATVIKYQISSDSWSFSQAISTRDSPNITLIKAQNNDLYMSFADLITNNSGRTVARAFKLTTGATSWTELKHTNTEVEGGIGIDDPVNFLSIAVGADGNEYISYTKTEIAFVRTFSPGAPPEPEPVEPDIVVNTPKQMEFLDRGVVAARISGSQVLVSWRLLGTDPSAISFNVYRNGIRLNGSPITNSTNYIDNINTNESYTIKEVIEGVETNESKPTSTWASNYKKIQLDRPTGGITPDNVGYDYAPFEASVGDADGDGEYELFVKWEPSNYKDNSEEGYTGNVYIDCYKLNGTKLWRIDLGKNIRAGAHYTQFMVYDFDGDGKAEMACKTADGTIDGTGATIGNANADYRNSKGYVLTGPEFLTMFNGLTGKALSTVDFVPGRGSVSAWGDNYGNRVDRFVSAVAYLDGQKPSLIIGRGYYTRLVRVAWDFRNGELQQRWVFDSNDTGNNRYAGQGNHQLSVADVDGDGKDEIINGSSVINDNGKGLWSDGKGHGDALHVTDMDPSTPEKEIWMNHEEQSKYTPYGLRLKNAKTGETIWGVQTTGDIGRCMVGDIDPNYPGYEVWGASGVYSIKGELISTKKPSENFGIWWDGDLSREIYDRTRIDKWNSSSKSVNNLITLSNILPVSGSYTTKAVPVLSGDILGDWREEVILWGDDKSSLYLFTTPYETNHRMHTLMHDPQYRVAIAWQNTAYNQPPYPSFFLGTNMQTPALPNIYTVKDGTVPVRLIAFDAKTDGYKVVLSWKTVSELNNEQFTIERSSDAKNFETILYKKGAGNSSQLLTYISTDYSPLIGKSYYRLRQTDFNGKSSLSEVKAVNISPKNQQLSLSPNPVLDRVTINLSSESNLFDYLLTSAEGKIILSGEGNITDINKEINNKLPLLKSGIYIIKLTDNDNTYSEKLLKH